MGDELRRAGGGGSQPGGDDDESQLRGGGGREQQLEVALTERYESEGDGCHRSGPGGGRAGPSGGRQQWRQPQQQVAAHGDHRRRMEQRTDRARAVHGPGDPEREDELGCLTEGGHHDPGGHDVAPPRRGRRRGAEIESRSPAEGGRRGEVQPQVGGAGGEERHEPRADPATLTPPEPDQRIRRGAHHLPPQQQCREAGRRDRDQHGRREQQHEPVEAPRRVADVDRGGDQHEHGDQRDRGGDHRRQAVDPHPEPGSCDECDADPRPCAGRDETPPVR